MSWRDMALTAQHHTWDEMRYFYVDSLNLRNWWNLSSDWHYICHWFTLHCFTWIVMNGKSASAGHQCHHSAKRHKNSWKTTCWQKHSLSSPQRIKESIRYNKHYNPSVALYSNFNRRKMQQNTGQHSQLTHLSLVWVASKSKWQTPNFEPNRWSFFDRIWHHHHNGDQALNDSKYGVRSSVAD